MSAEFISMGGFSSRTLFQDIKQKDTKYKVVHFFPFPSVQGWENKRNSTFKISK